MRPRTTVRDLDRYAGLFAADTGYALVRDEGSDGRHRAARGDSLAGGLPDTTTFRRETLPR